MFKQFAGLVAGLTAAFAVCAVPTVELTTSQFKITVELYADKAPKTVAAFLQHARKGFYDGTIFHRVIPGFMVQGGGFTPNLEEKPSNAPNLQNEADNGLRNERGTLAMARRGDPHSARNQFFINLQDNEFLNHRAPTDGQSWGYAVFGKVTQGMEFVDSIARVPTGNQGFHQNVPLTPVVIKSVKIISEK